MEINDSKYKADLELLDRYQSFSSELLRLSLLGIAIFGILSKVDSFSIGSIKNYILWSILCFGLSASFALAHRFFSSKGIYHHLRYLRKEHLQDKTSRNWAYQFSGILLAAASLFLGVGAVVIVVGFAKGLLG